ncbi:MAG: pirin family protein [Synechococcaceae cyanobacterium SM2_3_2]|nr:pirin family protein [Synechococcaceae cyanobacterium SM2_3_2]
MTSQTLTPAITVRRSHERGHANFGWLDSYHSFSFGNYYDPAHMGFRTLRVINQDVIAAGAGFPTHPHRDMEIVTYVLEGAVEHKDSLGTGSIIRPGEIQRMTAGTGIRHSEFNPSPTDPLHLLQIWILPEAVDLDPSYEQKETHLADQAGQFKLIASRDGRQGSVTVHQDINLYAAQLQTGDQVSFDLKPGRAAWIQVARGDVRVLGRDLASGDAAAVEHTDTIAISATQDAEILLFDLA